MADSDIQPDEEAGGDQTEQPNILDMSDEDVLRNRDNLLHTINDVDPH